MRETHALRTSHGLIWIEQSGHEELPVLLIHGNSSCLEVFRHQIDGPLARQNRLIAFDLPGHGRSSDAIDPARTYTLPGFADVSREILSLLAVEEAVVLGWSLGGHIALEMMQEFSGARGLVLVGAPPVDPETFSKGFRPSPHFKLAAEAKWSDADVERFGHAVFDEAFSPDLKTALVRADGRARSTLFEARRAGVGADERKLVEISDDADRGARWRRGPIHQSRLSRQHFLQESLARAVSENRRRRACAVPSEAYRVQWDFKRISRRTCQCRQP